MRLVLVTSPLVCVDLNVPRKLKRALVDLTCKRAPPTYARKRTFAIVLRIKIWLCFKILNEINTNKINTF